MKSCSTKSRQPADRDFHDDCTVTRDGTPVGVDVFFELLDDRELRYWHDRAGFHGE